MQRTNISNALFGIALLFCTTVIANASDCSTTCANKMYNSGKCDGTAPSCEGTCASSPSSMEDYWMNGKSPVICPGHCTSGNSCWTGHKECTCYQATNNCAQTCEQYPVLENGNLLHSSWTSSAVPPGYNSTNARTPAAGLSGWTINYCWCLYQPPVPWSKITGAWVEKQTVNGDASITMDLSVGTESTDSTATTQSWSKSFTTAVSAGFNFDGSTGSVTISGTVAEETATTITESTTHTMTESCSVECPSPASLNNGYEYLSVWQWTMYGYQGDTETTTVQSCNFFCIYSASSKPMPPKCPPTDCAAGDPFCQTCISTPTADVAVISVQNGAIQTPKNHNLRA